MESEGWKAYIRAIEFLIKSLHKWVRLCSLPWPMHLKIINELEER